MSNYISCLCGCTAQEVSLESLGSSSPLPLCHCDSCRLTTGMLFSAYLILQSSPRKFDSLIEYQQSDHVSRWFCGKCGAHVFVHLKPQNKYFVASGLLTAKAFQTEAVQHWRIEDTRDGGLSPFLPGTKAAVATCWVETSQFSYQGSPQRQLAPLNPAVNSEEDNQLHARCHCGGIQFYVTRPDASSSNASSPWPDLLVPYCSASSDNPEDVKWWLRAENTKYLAGTCACISCRLASGFPIQSWAFIPKSNIFKPDHSPLNFNMKTMQRYESSPAVYREFCNRCGATVFWHCEERPDVIDVSVGLLRAKSGARAEEWLEWATGRVSFAEDASDKMLIRILETGLQDWGKKSSLSEQDPTPDLPDTH